MTKPWVTVVTTLPQGLGPCAQEIRTERLLIRPLAQSDLLAFHRLRRQPEFTRHTTAGIPDADLETTQANLDRIIAVPRNSGTLLPFHTYFGIFLRKTGELVGDGGVHTLTSPACGWPELGCKFGREHHSCGYGTEFLHAFAEWWWSLPRYREGEREEERRDEVMGGRAASDAPEPVQVRLRVHMDSVLLCDPPGGGGIPVGTDIWAIEQMYAWIAPENHASQKMAVKAGWERFVEWEHPVKKIPVQGWRQTCGQYFASCCPSKL